MASHCWLLGICVSVACSSPLWLTRYLQPPPAQPWTPNGDYEECEIKDLQPGPKAVTFMGRVANLFDLGNVQKGPRSARGGVKVCVRDEGAAVTVRLWYAARLPNLRLGCLVSVWTNHGKFHDILSGFGSQAD